MKKLVALIFVCVLAATSTAFTIDDAEESLEELAVVAAEESTKEVSEQARSSCLPTGSECDGSKDDCQCCGAYHECKCPFGINSPSILGPCKCSMDHLSTCLAKKKCPNKHLWGGGNCNSSKKKNYG